MTTEWKPIPNFSRYQTNSAGDIKRVRANWKARMLKYSLPNKHYTTPTAEIMNDDGFYIRTSRKNLLKHMSGERLLVHVPKSTTKKEFVDARTIESPDWKPIPGYEAYRINALGHVKRVTKTGKVKFYKVSDGGRVALSDGKGNTTTVSVAKIVARVFGNLGPEQYVTHRDDDQSENWIENLQVITNNSLTSHSSHGKIVRTRKKNHSPVYQHDVKTRNLLAVHSGLEAASKRTGVDPTAINRCINYKRRTAGGFVWRY